MKVARRQALPGKECRVGEKDTSLVLSCSTFLYTPSPQHLAPRDIYTNILFSPFILFLVSVSVKHLYRYTPST